MAVHDTNRRREHECFLCMLDTTKKQPCSTAQLSGQIIRVQERVIKGENFASFWLDTGTERVEVLLDRGYYRDLMLALQAKGDVLSKYKLMLRIYHLPTEPVRLERDGQTRLIYQGNSYTLAVLEPDILLNITDLNQAEYCARQYLLQRLLPSSSSTATVRGNLVHYCFKELLKEHDRGKLAAREGQDAEQALSALHRYLDQALQLNELEIALVGSSPQTMRAEIAPHLESLADWFERERNTLWAMPAVYQNDGEQEEEDNTDNASGNQVRAETFLLAPEIGLRGRLDLFWQQDGQRRLLELKTGGASGSLPKTDHRWQVHGYQALLTVRNNSKMKRAMATLLYSGTPGSAQAHGLHSTIREFQRVNQKRNTLILSRVTNNAPPPPGPQRCSKCALLEACQRVSGLLDWAPPQPDLEIRAQSLARRAITSPEGETGAGAAPSSRWQSLTTTPTTSEDRVFFARYYNLLHSEGKAGELQQALLWQQSVTQRVERGTAITGLEQEGRPVLDRDGWQLIFRCQNASELREGDEILLSNGDPITGEVVSGTITSISPERVVVWARELITHPTLIDRYDNDLVHVRTLQNLLRWQMVSPHLRDLVAGRVRPRFLEEKIRPRADFNGEQNLAVERALQMQDYLLIHGPPGTGKTSVIAEIVKRLIQKKQRVMLAAFTNQAVDNMLKRLAREGCTNFLRLGSERSIDESLRMHRLKELMLSTDLNTEDSVQTMSHEERVHDLLYTMPIIASTTATWSSDKYSDTSATGESGLYFDVAIIDEAGQLTLPAILGALRFARRFILVGDEKQLPPLVLSQEAAEEGLADSLFSFLKHRDEQHTQENPLTISACVPLLTQYRMNRWIANFSSKVFYNDKLIAHPSIANRKLVYKNFKREEDERIGQALDPQRPLVFVDVREDEKWRMEGETKQSHAEARAIRELVAGLMARGIELRDIGIIAPYRAQVANIRRYLFSADNEQGWTGLAAQSPISIDTVDRFQGGERPVIIMSFATIQEPLLESPRRAFLINEHRLNVALTRAQCKLILVGCVPALEPLPTFSRLIAYCRSMKTLIEFR